MIRSFLYLLLFALPASCVWSQQTEPSVAELIARSQEALDQGDSARASSLISQALQHHPEDEQLQLQQARILVYQHRDNRAIAMISAILRGHSADRNSKLLLAQIYGYEDRYSMSNALYRELLATNPADEAAAIGLIHNLVLQDKRQEARRQLEAALQQTPSSLRLQQYREYLSATPNRENGGAELLHRIQEGETFFTDNAGNRVLSSSQGLFYELRQNLSTRFRVEEDTLWKTGLSPVGILYGTDELRLRLDRHVAVEASGGAVAFANQTTRGVYSGDLELSPFRSLTISGGYSTFPILPTFDAAQFDLLAKGPHGRLDFRSHGFTLNGDVFFSHYSDGNDAEREYGELMKWFGGRALSLGAGYAVRHIHFDQQLDHGYFSPGQYWSHLGTAGARVQIGRVFHGEYLAYAGAEREDPTGYNPAGEAVASNQFFIHRWELDVNYSHFHLAQASGAFHADMASAVVSYRF
jgi:tetratricopeptide (TPR) repeat protein